MKKKIPFLVILLIQCTNLFLHAQTNVSGVISANTVWNSSGNPYTLINNVEVPAGVTLTIQPGVEIFGDSTLTIKGTLVCNGKADSLITLWSARLLFRSATLDKSQLNFTQFAFKGNTGSRLQIGDETASNQDSVKNSGNLTVSDAQFLTGSYASTSGYKTTASLSIINSKFMGNAVTSILPQSEPITFINCEIQTLLDCRSTNGGMTLKKCIVSNSNLDVNVTGTNFTIEDSKIIHCSFGGGSTIQAPITITNSLVYKAKNMYLPNSTLSINHSLFINDNPSVRPCFTFANGFIDSSSFIGNDQTALFYLKDYDGIVKNRTLKINHCTFSNHSFTISVENISSFLLRNSNFNLINKKYSVYNLSTTDLDAKNNWWGSTVPSFIDSTIYDINDSATYGRVDYTGLLNTVDTIAPISAPVSVTKRAVNGGVEFKWKPNKETDLAGYNIYWGKATEYSFNNSINAGNVNSYFIPGVSITDSFAITAYDRHLTGNDQIEGHESWFSYFTAPGFQNLDTSYCTTAGSFQLIAEPAGGVFSGPGVKGDVFDPSLVGPGKYELKYIYLSPDGSKNDTVTAPVTIYTPPVPGTLTASSTTLCEGDQATLTLSGYSGSTITWLKDSGGVYVIIPGANSTTYTTGPLNKPTTFMATIENGPCDSVSTSPVTILITARITAGKILANTTSICTGNSATLSLPSTIGTIQWQSSIDSLNWLTIPGETKSVYNTGPIKIKTYYRVIASGSCPSDTSDVCSVNVIPSFTADLTSTDSTTFCGGYGRGTKLTTTKDPHYVYQWLLNGTFIQGADLPTYFAGQTGNYAVKVTDTTSGCIAVSNQLSITAIYLSLKPVSLCMAGTDSITGKNKIVWEKPASTKIKSFYIYKETSTSTVYSIIGVVRYDSTSAFIDPNSNPNVKAEQYKIALLDSCDFLTESIVFHKTMHLNISNVSGVAWQLNWNDYEGSAVKNYRIYRGNSETTMHLIGTINRQTVFTDFSAPASGSIYYQIEAVTGSCNSKSNIATNKTEGINDYGNLFSAIEIYPVPNNGIFTLDFYSKGNEKATLKIVDLIGEVVFEENDIFIHSGQQSKNIHLENVPTGAYFLSLQSKGGSFTKKIMITK